MNFSHISTQTPQNTHVNLAGGKRILIVDDQEAVLIFLKDRLEKLGFVVSSALSGKEGKRLLQEHSFHGVLLDLEMPVTDGLAIMRELRKQSDTVPVIIMSADPTRTTMSKAIEAGASDYLTKPISSVILKYKCLRLFT